MPSEGKAKIKQQKNKYNFILLIFGFHKKVIST